MMGFWKRDDFKVLNKLWKQKLKDTGFTDLEDDKGNLASKDHRTKAFANPEATIIFYTLLTEYLHSKPLSERDRQILELYNNGIYITGKNGIIEQTGWSDRTIRNVIAKHKKIFLKE